MVRESLGIVSIESMSTLYFVTSFLFITTSFLGARLFLVSIPFFCWVGVSTYLYHPLNTNVEGYEYIVDKAIGFFSGAGTVEPGYNLIIYTLKSLFYNIEPIYISLDILAIGIIVYAYRFIVASKFIYISYTPLATLIAAYFPILFVFQQRSGTALAIVLIAFSLYENLFVSFPLLLFAVSIHIQSLSASLFYLIAWNIKSLFSFHFRIPRMLSKRRLIAILILSVCFIPILIASTSFLNSFALTQGLRYTGLSKYQGVRLTGFITLAICFVPWIQSLSACRNCLHNLTQPKLFDRIVVTTFVSTLLINIVFLGNLHFSTRFSRPFDFLLLTLSLYTYLDKSANNITRYFISLLSFSFLYLSWVI